MEVLAFFYTIRDDKYISKDIMSIFTFESLKMHQCVIWCNKNAPINVKFGIPILTFQQLTHQRTELGVSRSSETESSKCFSTEPPGKT